MTSSDDVTTLVCLFHHPAQAEAAIKDLHHAGVSEQAITLLDHSTTSTADSDSSLLSELGVPDRDLSHLNEGLRNGGSIVAVKVAEAHVSRVEEIFGDHKAGKIDEADYEAPITEPVPSAAQGEAAIPIVQEELLVGKRTVDEGGVRVYRRVIEIPVEQSINLRDEHIHIDRVALDRPATDADMAFGERTIELTEMAEEVVVGKTAHVVEEVVVGKEVSSHTEHIHDSVRHTEVEVEEIDAGNSSRSA